MKISEKILENISTLSKIKIEDELKPQLIKDLESILIMVDQMNEVNTDDIEAMSHPIDDAQNLRKDEVNKNIDREAYQEYAPATDDGFYLTPKVLEQND